MKEKVSKKYYKVAPEENNKHQKTYAYVCVKSTDTINSKGVHHKGKTTKKYFTPTAINKGIEITKEEFLNEYNKAKQLKRKKGKLTIIVSKNYKELYEDNLALVNHILLDTVKNDKEWVEKVQKSNLNITLYTDKNDTELFKKSFGKFEVKLIDSEELTLENIQVDCSELTIEQIEEMANIFHNFGFIVDYEELTLENTHTYLSKGEKDVWVRLECKSKTTIIYDKFMELFDTKKVMDNGSTISNVKEGEAKSIEELHVEHREQSFNEKYEQDFEGVRISYIDVFDQVPSHIFDALKFRTPQGQSMLKVDSNKVNTNHNLKPTFNPQSHYNNENGSLYQIAEQLGLNHYEFDIFKRLVRCRKKGQFEEDLNKIKDTIDLYLIESKK